MPHCLMEIKIINLQRAEFRERQKIRVKKWNIGLVHATEISLSSLYVCLYTCLKTLGHYHNETTDGVKEDLLAYLNQGITELLDGAR